VGGGVQEHEVRGTDAVSEVREFETRVAMCRKAEATNLCDSTRVMEFQSRVSIMRDYCEYGEMSVSVFR
jgi:hypothetical protein